MADEVRLTHPQEPDVEPASTCPPPLQWQEVLGEFRASAESWYLDRPNYRLTGHIWGTGRPLILLGGFAGSSQLFSLLVWLLRDQFRCILWDYPGTTQYTPAVSRLTLADLADDVAAVAGVAGETEVDLFASASGGLVALEAMQRHPSLVRKAILQNGFAQVELSRGERWLRRVARLLPGRVKYVPGNTAIAFENHRRWFPPFDETRFQFLREDLGYLPLKTLAARAALLRDPDLRTRLSNVLQPVLLLQTEGAGAASEARQRELAERLPHARVEFLSGAGQFAHLTHPHRVAKIVREFLAGPEVGPT